MRPSQILRKLAAYPRQNELAAALREVGRIERSLFMIDWTTDPGLRRRVQVGLNKGEAHHALKRAINFHQRGELRDRTGEGQHYRVAGLNLLDQPDGRIALATRRLHGRRETLKTVIDMMIERLERLVIGDVEEPDRPYPRSTDSRCGRIGRASNATRDERSVCSL